MLDTQLLRNDLPGVAARLKARGYLLDTAKFEQVESERKAIQTRTQELQARRNALSKQIGIAKGRGEDASKLLADVGDLGEELERLEAELARVQYGLREFLLNLPNLTHPTTPIGTSSLDNAEV